MTRRTRLNPNATTADVPTAATFDPRYTREYVLPAPSGGDDGPAVNAAIAAAPSGSTVTSRPGSIYLIATPVVLHPNLSYRFHHHYNGRTVTPAGSGGTGTVFKQADGANLNHVVAAQAYTKTGTGNSMDAPIRIDGLCIDGNKANQTSGAGHGLVLANWRSIVTRSTILQARGHGVMVTDRQLDANAISNGLGFENRIESCTVDSCGGRGLFVQNAGNHCTDGFVRDCVFGFTGLEGVRVDSSAGWSIAGNHIYATNLDGITIQGGYATRIGGNYIEGFGSVPGTTSTTWSSATTYDRYAIVTSSGVIYYSLIENNLNNSPASTPSAWAAQLASNGVWGIGSFAGGFPRSVDIYDNEVSVGHQSITLQTGWNYRAFLAQGSTSGTSTVKLHDNTAANEQNGSGAANTMALRASLASGAGNLSTHHNVVVGSFGTANSIDVAWSTSPISF